MENKYKWLNEQMDSNLIPVIEDFIRIPNQSRAFDPEWETNGLQQKACHFCMDWAKKQDVKGLTLELIEEKGRTPVVLGIIEAPTKDKPTVLMYGHIDKQPPLLGEWDEGLHPYEPVTRDGKLYGRAGADDGYAFFASLLMIKALQRNGVDHNRVVLYFETDEESGSKDLIYFLKQRQEQIGTPSLVICLDSGCCDYEHLCLTTTLRGVCNFSLKCSLTKEGVHSGSSSGIIPDSFRVLKELIDRFEDPKTGRLPTDLYVNVPSDKYDQAESLIKEMGGKIDFGFPFLEGVEPMEQDGFKQYMNRIWNPTLTYIGVEGIPDISQCGNVLRPHTTLKLSVRLPPTLKKEKAEEVIKKFFTENKALYNAKVECEIDGVGQGFNSPAFDKKLKALIDEAGKMSFGKESLYYGEGGSIPFINELATMYPDSQFIVTGVLGPQSNAHGPNEFLHLPFMKKLIVSLTRVLEGYAEF